MQADRSGTHPGSYPHRPIKRGRPVLSFELSDLSELVAYLRPGASFHLAEHIYEALFAGTADQPADVVARCRDWARERHCIPRWRPNGGIELTRLDGTCSTRS
jgi:hypothetical protein